MTAGTVNLLLSLRWEILVYNLRVNHFWVSVASKRNKEHGLKQFQCRTVDLWVEDKSQQKHKLRGSSLEWSIYFVRKPRHESFLHWGRANIHHVIWPKKWQQQLLTIAPVSLRHLKHLTLKLPSAKTPRHTDVSESHNLWQHSKFKTLSFVD